VDTGSLILLKTAGLPASILNDFNRPSTLLLSERDRVNPLAPRASIAFSFTSASALTTALWQHRIPARVRYVLLDLERWPLTPTVEQQHPIASLRSALAAANAAGKCVVFTPALDLLNAMHYGGPLPGLIGYFDQLIVHPAAGMGDVFEVQSQQTEGTPLATVLTPKAVAASLAERPGSPVLVGLSTNPNGRQVSASDLLTLYRAGASAGAVGYWLNIPDSSPQCPTCGEPQIRVAVSFLEALARDHWQG
jgi:hypothetical protein